MNLFLTSTGLKLEIFKKEFLMHLKRNISECKVIFVPTAANDDGAKSLLPSCKEDLLSCGILPENIFVYDLDYLLDFEQAKEYDAIYFCGGSTRYLLERLNNSGFVKILTKLVENGMYFIGVSAGSKICGDNYENNLGYLKRDIELHCEKGSPFGRVEDDSTIYLTNTQALVVNDSEWFVIGE